MNDLQNKIMRRVLIIHSLRRLISPIMIKLYVITGLFVAVVSKISLPDVIQNLPKASNFDAQVNFFSTAFAHADSAIKLALISVIVLALWLAKDAISSLLIPKTSFMRQGAR